MDPTSRGDGSSQARPTGAAVRLLYAAFFLSGAAALMYESVWTRYLGLFVGHDAYAQVLVLVIFLGGMSVGAESVARVADRLERPLLWYAGMEGAAGLIGLLFHGAFLGVTSFAYGTLFPVLAGSALLGPAKWAIAALLILPQSVLLGTTFPLMSAAVLRRAPAQPGRVLGWLYFTNSLGAAIGVLVAGFVLLALAGLPGVLVSAAILNLLVALVAFLVSRSGDAAAVAAMPRDAQRPGDRVTRLLLASAFVTAVASFCYEIGWIRMLSLLLGSATHSFELMLSAFILGLAIGAFWVRRNADRFADPVGALAQIQIVMGLLALATLPLYLGGFHVLESVMAATARNGSGYLVFTAVRYLICLVVMLPATICAGMTLPLITRTLLARGQGESAIGRVYALNTVGSIVGAALAGLLLLPLLGLKGLLLLGGVLDISVGVALFQLSRPSRHRAVLLLGVALAVAVIVAVTRLDPLLITSGVFRSGKIIPSGNATMRYYRDGRTATVTVSEAPNGLRVLATNGKSDASLARSSRAPCDSITPKRALEGDESTQLLLGLIPLAYNPAARRAGVVGLGSGMSSHALLSSPTLREVVTIEIEPRMIDGAKLFMPANHRIFLDPRSHIVVGDAKSYFAASNRPWDIIVSEPSNPWVSGVSGLFTEEFYRRVRQQLAPGGVFGQWLQAYELDDAMLLTVLTSFHRVFPDWRVHQVGVADLLLVGSRDGTLPPPDWASVIASSALEGDLCRTIPITVEALESSLHADRALLAPVIVRFGTANSDFFPVLDLGAEQRRYEQRTATGMLSLGDRWFNLSRALVNRPQPPVDFPTLLFPGLRRSSAMFQRTWQSRTAPLDSAAWQNVARARYAWQNWSATLAADQTPADWRPWLQQFNEVALMRHFGTAGWVDSTLYDSAEHFAVKHAAPRRVLAVLHFRRAVQEWDAPAALTAARQMADTAAVGQGWIGGEELQDGAVVAALRMRDHTLAAQWYFRLAGYSSRPLDDMRSLILRAWIADER
ncbi:MAG: spermidine synthase [Gemmatimonadota bacterium]